MKKIISVALLLFVFMSSAHAVLKERNLEITLSVLHSELKASYESQQQMIAEYQQRCARQHQQLIGAMTRCEQMGIMLYSHNMDNTFEVAYVCSEVKDLCNQTKRLMDGEDRDKNSYSVLTEKARMNIERYESLIRTLKSIPPVIESRVDAQDTVLITDKQLIHALDSLKQTYEADSLYASTLPAERLFLQKLETENDNPLFLTGTMLEDREKCIYYAQALFEDLEKYLDALEKDRVYYESVNAKVNELYSFATKRYEMMQSRVLTENDDWFPRLLLEPRDTWMRLKRAMVDRYRPLPAINGSDSDWRGFEAVSPVLLFLLTYAFIFCAMHFILTYYMRRHPTKEKLKSHFLMLRSIISFGVIIVFTTFVGLIWGRHNQMLAMGIPMLLNLSWLLLGISLSLYFRLDGALMNAVSKIYMPLSFVALAVVVLRMTLAPDIIIHLVAAPIFATALYFTLHRLHNCREDLPMQDMAFSWAAVIILSVCFVCSLIGCALYAVMILVWWCYLMAFLMTISCISGFVKLRTLKILKQEWLYYLIVDCIVPIMIIVSFIYSLYWAASLFTLGPYVDKMLFATVSNDEGMYALSFLNVLEVVALWFVFRYIKNLLVALFKSFHKKSRRRSEDANITLVNNVIAIFVWGTFFIAAMFVFKVPKSGISIVTAGLATGLGFAMKDLIENFVYGLSLMTGRLRVGDVIDCDGISGRVTSISYQNTQIATFDGCVVSILNKTLFSEKFRNFTRNGVYVRVDLKFGVAYGSDIDRVETLVRSALETFVTTEKGLNGEPFSDLSRYPISICFTEMADSSLNFVVRVWLRFEDRISFMNQANRTIYDTLNANGINIPFPQRDIHIIKD